MMTDINLFVLLPKENKTFGKRTIAKMSKYAVILPNTPKLVANAQKMLLTINNFTIYILPRVLTATFPQPQKQKHNTAISTNKCNTLANFDSSTIPKSLLIKYCPYTPNSIKTNCSIFPEKANEISNIAK